LHGQGQNFPLLRAFLSGYDAQPAPIEWRTLHPSEIKQPRLEAERANPSSVEIKNAWIYT